MSSDVPAILRMVDGLNTPTNRTYTNEQLGAAFRSYVRESFHNSWDGFSRQDRSAILRMLGDMAIYIKNIEEDKCPQLQKPPCA